MFLDVGKVTTGILFRIIFFLMESFFHSWHDGICWDKYNDRIHDTISHNTSEIVNRLEKNALDYFTVTWINLDIK